MLARLEQMPRSSLWWVLLKERNHLLTMRDWARAQRANIPNPQRIIKVQAACESHPALVHVCVCGVVFA